MKIIIHTDGAWSSPDKSAFAYWIECNQFSLQGAARINIKMMDHNAVELYAIQQALTELNRKDLVRPSFIKIVTDSAIAINAITYKSVLKNDQPREIAKECNFLMMDLCIKHRYDIRNIDHLFYLQHVKAHTGRADENSARNHWCDEHAKKYKKNHTPLRHYNFDLTSLLF